MLEPKKFPCYVNYHLKTAKSKPQISTIFESIYNYKSYFQHNFSSQYILLAYTHMKHMLNHTDIQFTETTKCLNASSLTELQEKNNQTLCINKIRTIAILKAVLKSISSFLFSTCLLKSLKVLFFYACNEKQDSLSINKYIHLPLTLEEHLGTGFMMKTVSAVIRNYQMADSAKQIYEQRIWYRNSSKIVLHKTDGQN